MTLDVRTLLEARKTRTLAEQHVQRLRAATLIKDRLDEFLHWAARDGGYDRLNYVANVVVEVVESEEVQADIVRWITARMTALVRVQQEFLREDRDESEFWATTYPVLMRPAKRKRGGSSGKRLKMVRAGMKRGRTETPDVLDGTESTNSMATVRRAPDFGDSRRQLFKKRKIVHEDAGSPPRWKEQTPSPARVLTPTKKKKKTRRSSPVVIKTESPDHPTPRAVRPTVMLSETEEEGDTVITPRRLVSIDTLRKVPPGSEVRYRRKPPVIYGLFVLGTSVLILTADASKGANAYISFHLDISFADNHQSVWNALTIAAIVCAARDDLMTRTDDFVPLPLVEESDPDA